MCTGVFINKPTAHRGGWGAEYEGGGVYLLVIKIVYYSFSHTQVAYLCTVVGLPVLRRKRVVAKTIEDYRTEIVL